MSLLRRLVGLEFAPDRVPGLSAQMAVECIHYRRHWVKVLGSCLVSKRIRAHFASQGEVYRYDKLDRSQLVLHISAVQVAMAATYVLESGRMSEDTAAQFSAILCASLEASERPTLADAVELQLGFGDVPTRCGAFAASVIPVLTGKDVVGKLLFEYLLAHAHLLTTAALLSVSRVCGDLGTAERARTSYLVQRKLWQDRWWAGAEIEDQIDLGLRPK